MQVVGATGGQVAAGGRRQQGRRWRCHWPPIVYRVAELAAAGPSKPRKSPATRPLLKARAAPGQHHHAHHHGGQQHLHGALHGVGLGEGEGVVRRLPCRARLRLWRL